MKANRKKNRKASQPRAPVPRKPGRGQTPVPLSPESSRRLRVATKVVEFITSRRANGTEIVIPFGSILVQRPDGNAEAAPPREIEEVLQRFRSSGKLGSVTRIQDGFKVTPPRTAPKPAGPKPAATTAPSHRSKRLPGPAIGLPRIGDVMREVLAAVCAGTSRHADIRTAAARALGVDPRQTTRQRFGESLDKMVSESLHAHHNLGNLVMERKNISALPAGRERLASGAPFKGDELPRRYRPSTGNAPSVKATPSEAPPSRGTSVSVGKVLASIPEMTPDRLVHLWRNANRILADAKLAGKHAAARQVVLAVEEAWDSLVLDKGELFPWPSTEIGNAQSGSSPSGFRSEGMLSYLEYRVGKNADLPAVVRQSILSRVFEGKLPRVFEPAYMNEWGDPNSARRLRKMAESLAAFARNFKRLDEDKYDEAIRQWEQDLDFLYHRYYVGRFGFGWPTTEIGLPPPRMGR